MGKLSDALEKHEGERSIEVEQFSRTTHNRPISEEKNIVTAESIGNHEFSPKVVVTSAPDSVVAENFKILRANLLFGENGRIPRTIMVTSSFPGEGKTFVSVNLSVSLAMGIDEHVLLVDGDLRRPQVHGFLGYGNRQGLHDCLVGKKQAEDLIIQTPIDKLSLLTAGELPSNPTELLSSASMRAFLEDTRRQSEDQFIIIDSAPAYTTAEAKILAEYVDGIILVTMAQQSQRKAVQKVVNNLGKEKIIGIVFNGYDQSDKGYYKYYEKYYKGN